MKMSRDTDLHSELTVRIMFFYISMGGFWILLAAALIIALRAQMIQINWFYAALGGVYMLISAVLLNLIVQRSLSAFRHTEERLRYSENMLLRAQRMAGVGTWERNLDTDEISWSPVMYTLYGVDESSPITQQSDFVKFVYPDDIESVIESENEIRRGRVMVARTYRIVRPDGQLRFIRSEVEPLYNPAGRRTHIAGVAQDITSQVEYESRIVASEKRYKSLVEHNPDAICAIDRELVITTINKAFELLLGYTAAEIVGQSLMQWIEAGVQAFEQDMMAAIEMVDIPSFECTEIILRHCGGRLVYTKLTVIPIYVDGIKEGLYVILQDCSEQKQTEELLRNYDKLSAVGELAAGVAHEIRNPLTALKGFLQLLHQSVIDKDHYFDIMLSELQRIENIVNELLMLAKPQKVTYKDCDLGTLLSSVVSLLEMQSIMSNVQIHFERPQQVTIYGEENQLKQVFINLLKNSIEAMPDGGDVHISWEASSNHIFVRIQDSGPGVPEHLIDRLGEPFYTTKQHGTGLGLLVSKRILHAHQGLLGISSEEGIGTCAEVRLPIVIHMAKTDGHLTQ